MRGMSVTDCIFFLRRLRGAQIETRRKITLNNRPAVCPFPPLVATAEGRWHSSRHPHTEWNSSETKNWAREKEGWVVLLSGRRSRCVRIGSYPRGTELEEGISDCFVCIPDAS
jgi:hypothetical protein